MSPMASQITGVSVVYSTVCTAAHQTKRQSSASLAFVRGIHRSPRKSPHKGPVPLKLFPFNDVIMSVFYCNCLNHFISNADEKVSVQARKPSMNKEWIHEYHVVVIRQTHIHIIEWLCLCGLKGHVYIIKNFRQNRYCRQVHVHKY